MKAVSGPLYFEKSSFLELLDKMHYLKNIPSRLIGFVFTCPLAFIIILWYLKMNAYQTPLNIWVFLLPLLITAIVVFMSILIYINKLARTNIVEVLKDE